MDADEEQYDEGYVDQLELENEHFKAFLHKKKLRDEFDRWEDSEEMEQDLKEYERDIEGESEEMDMNAV